MLQYKVPQNVGIEDRIVGPLTLRQLIILAAGGGTSYLLFAISSKFYDLNVFEYIVIAIPAFISVLAALVKINDITFSKFVLLFLEFNIKPRKRFWDHRAISDLTEPDLMEHKPTPSRDSVKRQDQSSVNLETLSRMLDSGGFKSAEAPTHKDIDDVQDEYLLTQAFFGTKKDANADNMYWRCKETHEARLKVLAKQPPMMATQKKDAPAVQTVQATAAETPAEKPRAPTVKASPPPPASKSVPSKKAFRGPIPVRKDSQVNTLQKNKPLQYTSPAPQKTAKPSEKQPSQPVSSPLGEISFEELKKGEIEINLD